MINLLTNLFQRLSENNNADIHFEQAAQGTEYPYAVWNISDPNGRTELDRDDYIIEIDVWDYVSGNDTTRLENLTSDIDEDLKGLRHIDSEFFFMFERIGWLPIADPDSNIRRRQLRYQVKTYKR